MNITGLRIRKTRKSKGMTQEELAEKVGLTKSTIAKYENGQIINIKKNVLCKIAVNLGVTYHYLLDIDAPAYVIDKENMTEIEDVYIDKYKRLDKVDKKIVVEYIDRLLQNA